jgi:hypothetical protein
MPNVCIERERLRARAFTPPRLFRPHSAAQPARFGWSFDCCSRGSVFFWFTADCALSSAVEPQRLVLAPALSSGCGGAAAAAGAAELHMPAATCSQGQRRAYSLGGKAARPWVIALTANTLSSVSSTTALWPLPRCCRCAKCTAHARMWSSLTAPHCRAMDCSVWSGLLHCSNCRRTSALKCEAGGAAERAQAAGATAKRCAVQLSIYISLVAHRCPTIQGAPAANAS